MSGDRLVNTRSNACQRSLGGVSVGCVALILFGLSCAAAQAPLPDKGEERFPKCAGEHQTQPILLVDAVEQSLQDQPQLVIARANEVESRADARSAVSAFLPSGQFAYSNERYEPANPSSPPVVIGNTVLGGANAKTAYSSLSVTWNLMHSGRDVAAYRGAQAGVRSAGFDVDKQTQETLSDVLRAYSELYESGVAAQDAAKALAAYRALQSRAKERFESGHGTTVAVGQARSAEFDAEQTLNRACREVSEKSASLAQAIGSHVFPDHALAVQAALPLPAVEREDTLQLEDVIEASPAVTSAKEKIAAARAKLQQSERAFGPSISLTVQRDYLAQSLDSFGEANRHIAPYDYWVGLTFQQPLFPLLSEASEVSKARAEVRKAQAAYDQARLEAEGMLQSALAAQEESDASYAAAKASYTESQKVLSLTQAQYRAGRTDLDSVEHAQIDADKATADVQSQASKRAFAAWMALRALRPADFTGQILHQLHLTVDAASAP
jgi:outer membrane protein TolC